MPGFDPVSLGVGTALSLANSVGKYISGVKQTKESKLINPIWNPYKKSGFADKQLGIAQQLFNGRMAGAPQLQNNIFSSQGNTLDAINRNATDSSQALALAAGAQGQTNESLQDLQIKEAQNKAMMLQNLNQAYGVNIGEGDKEYQSMLKKYGMDVDRKDALRASGALNKYGAVSDVASMGFTLGTNGMFGGMGGGKMKQFGGSGMGAVPYGASVLNQLQQPRPRFTLNN